MSKKVVDITVQILKEIRDEIRQTNARLDHVEKTLAKEIRETNARLDQLNARVEVLERTVADMATQFAFIARYIRNSVARQNRRLDELDSRVKRLEQRMGSG